MRIFIYLFFLGCLSLPCALQAQVPKDAAVALSATLKFSPLGITLNWPNPSTSNIIILRRTKGQSGTEWIGIANLSNTTQSTYTDEFNIVMGETYEYVIQRATTFNAFGYAHVAVRAPVTDSRGKVLVFVDSTTADALGVELVRLKNDMRGDGWVATPYKVGPSATPASVKAQIISAYNEDPANVKAVLLIGAVPVPYSGDANWDGHDDHAGAWPADSYYADLNGNWTDNQIDDTTPGRDANDNVPGDGKFDQSIIPSAVELQVGRIDFRRLDAAAFGEADVIGLIRRYLDKDHAFRTGAYKVDNRALVDDNFGFFGGETFASNGFRNAYPLVGEANVVEGDFFGNSANESWLLGYGCGGGWYQGASGVGSSSDFATKTVNIVFTNLFGSYHGDWDHESNPFMPSALASRGGILTCSWAGRPHWFNQALASGETIGYCNKETQNARFNNGFFQSLVGESGAHTALLGDPTLRAHVVPPPVAVTLSKACSTVEISWAEPGEPVDGYHIYRSFSNDGPYTRISTSLITGTSFLDPNPVDDTLYYQVRSIKMQSTPGGGSYLNNSVGPIEKIVFAASTPPVVSIANGTLTCAQESVQLSAQSQTAIVEWSWTGPGNFSSTDAVVTVSAPGNYHVDIIDENRCSAEANGFVEQNTIQPVLNVISSAAALTCEHISSTLSVNSAAVLDENSYNWSTGSNATSIEVNQPGLYQVTVTATSNGCTGSGQFMLGQDIEPPVLDIPSPQAYTCSTPCITLNLPNRDIIDYFLDNDPVAQNQTVDLCFPGIYEVLAVSTSNGCSATQSVEINANVAEPGASIGGSSMLTCQMPSIQLSGSASAADVSFLWSGPSINASNEQQQNPTVSQAGIYTLTVTDNENGCTSVATQEVTIDSSIPTVSATGGTLTCLSPVVELSATASGTVTYFWNGPNGFVSTEPSPVAPFAGTYTLTVTSPQGCSNTTSVEVIDDTQAPQFDFVTLAQLNCAVTCVTIDIIPISQGIVYDPVQACEPGIYDITVTGQNGCSATKQIEVTQAPPFEAGLDPAFVDCDGTAAISAVASGGTPPYTYLWSNGSTFSSALFILNGQPISVTVSDFGGCVWTSGPVTIPVPPQLVINSSVTNENGVGAANGAIDLTLTGGTPPFLFAWSNGANTEDISGLSGGTYTVTITEATTGCTTEASFVVTTSVDVKEATLLQSLSLSPNPTKAVSNLTVVFAEAQSVQVEIRDALGRLVQELPGGTYQSFSMPVDLKGQQAGVYYVHLILDSTTIVRKLIKVE